VPKKNGTSTSVKKTKKNVHVHVNSELLITPLRGSEANGGTSEYNLIKTKVQMFGASEDQME